MLTIRVQYGKYWPRSFVWKGLLQDLKLHLSQSCLIPYLTTTFSWYMELDEYGTGMASTHDKMMLRKGYIIETINDLAQKQRLVAFQTSFDVNFPVNLVAVLGLLFL